MSFTKSTKHVICTVHQDNKQHWVLTMRVVGLFGSSALNSSAAELSEVEGAVERSRRGDTGLGQVSRGPTP